MAEPAAPKPRIIIAQVAGSGTAPELGSPNDMDAMPFPDRASNKPLASV
jgi:hypothetical protein